MAQISRSGDLTSGPMLQKIILFSLPLAASSILQLLFNAADIIVVGQFVGPQALAAVGSTSALIQLIVNLFIGLSIGVNVLVARFTGAKDAERVCETVHTAVLLSLVGGAVLAVVGFAAARPLLEIMGSPEDVIDLAELYIRIIFIGMPVQMLYNFCAAVLRAVGDTKRPLYFLTIAGVINAGLNLVFVIGFKMSVAGVALATIISQAVSAALVTRSLMLMDGPTQLHLDRLAIKPHIMRMIIQIGLPAGLQSVVFNKAAMAVDTHVFRVSHRIGLVPDSCTTPFSVEKELVKNIPEKLIPIAHHWLILHGRYVCQARTPKCDTCGLQMMCKYFCNTYKVTKEAPKAKNK